MIFKHQNNNQFITPDNKLNFSIYQMASISSLPFLSKNPSNSNLISLNLLSSSFPLSFQLAPHRQSVSRPALKTGSEGRGGLDPYSADLLRKPLVSPVIESASAGEEEDEEDEKSGEDGNGWVDWEDQILEDTVPLVGLVRMVLHSGRYAVGDRLSPHHERTILEKVLPYHPECEKKIGSGVDYVKVGYHPNFDSSRCLFIVQKDGEVVDFSYWKCIKGLIRKKYPLYAESFILRHFRKPQRGY